MEKITTTKNEWMYAVEGLGSLIKQQVTVLEDLIAKQASHNLIFIKAISSLLPNNPEGSNQKQYLIQEILKVEEQYRNQYYLLKTFFSTIQLCL